MADQAANVKNAFSSTLEVEDVLLLTKNLIRRQQKKDNLALKEKLRLSEEEEAGKALNISIENFNNIDKSIGKGEKRSAQQVLDDLEAEAEYEETDEADISDELNDTNDDADEEALLDDSTNFENEDHYANEPCACHNIQLVLKDAFKECPEFENLIKKVSKNIVSKSKFSTLIAEELRVIGKKFAKRVVTRFNSILFTARSVIAILSIKELREKCLIKVKSKRMQRTRFS